MYVGDNQNVHCWIESRRCHNRFAAFLCRLLTALEVAYGFETVSAYLRTYHNVSADALTRLDPSEVEEPLRSKGLQRVDLR
eukprot:4005826-Lingulodinium_polyedra.AAC.1